MAGLFVSDDAAAEARQLAQRITEPLFEHIHTHTTVSVERTVLRWFGLDGVSALGAPLVNVMVDRLNALLQQRYELSESDADELLAEATEAESDAIDLYRFTSSLNRALDERGRQQIVEMLWQVAYADGQVTEFEDNLIWRAADLLHVPTRVRVELRARVSAGAGTS